MVVIESSSMALKLLKLAKILYNSESYCYPRSRNSSFCSKFAKPGSPPHSSKGGGAMFWSYVDLLLCWDIFYSSSSNTNHQVFLSYSSSVLSQDGSRQFGSSSECALVFVPSLNWEAGIEEEEADLTPSLPYKNCSSKVNIHPCLLYSGSEYEFLYTCTGLQRHYCRRF